MSKLIQLVGKSGLLVLVICFLGYFSYGQNIDDELQLVEVNMIWDQAPHNAFTDLVHFKNHFYCVFREGKGHVSPDGALRVIRSKDGKEWESVALITSDTMDLRDAKITITPEGRLMLSGAGALHDKSKHTHQSLSWFSRNGKKWDGPYSIGDPDFWLWRTTWHKGEAFSMGYECGENKSLRLYKSTDGKQFETLVQDMGIYSYPNETSIVFKGDTALCLLRRDGDEKSALLGTAVPPYTNWDWTDLGTRAGGPHMLLMPDGRLLAAVRLYLTGEEPDRSTSLCWIDRKNGTLTEALRFPSGGDTSYAGMVLKGDELWVSYYSGHKEKSSIYMARVKIN